MWKKIDEDGSFPSDGYLHSPVAGPSASNVNSRSAHQLSRDYGKPPLSPYTSCMEGDGCHRSNGNPGNMRVEMSRKNGSKERPGGIGYRELREQERFPGLDKETARAALHSSSGLALSQQHIYSEPSFETPSPPPLASAPSKSSKKFTFAFWK